MGSRKDPDRIIPLGLSARDRVLPIWEPLYSSKAASWVGMLLERVILGVVAAVGLTMLVSWPFALKDMESAGGDGSSAWSSDSGSPPIVWECRLSLVSSWD